jgi:hypothetical protein
VQAIVEGLRESVVAFAHGVEGTSPKDIMDMVLLTQVRLNSTLAKAPLPIPVAFLTLQVEAANQTGPQRAMSTTSSLMTLGDLGLHRVPCSQRCPFFVLGICER